MSAAVAPTPAELDRAAEVVAALEKPDRLAALVYDVATRQAEGGALWSGEKFIAGRAEAHGLTRDDADTPLGNALDVLERGPDSGLHYALLSALFVRGFADATRVRASERAALCAKLAAHGDFLELGSPYRVLSALPRLADPELAAEVYAALGELVLRDDAAAAAPDVRARNAGRIAALGATTAAAARAALERIERDAADGYSRALAGVALGRTPRMPEPECKVHGRASHAPRSVLGALLGWLSGVALLRWVGRLGLLAIGVRRDVELELVGDAVRVQRRTRLLGRVVRDAEQLHPLSRLRWARRAERYPALPFVVGAFAFALGLVLAGVFAADALHVGDASLLGLGALFLLSGAGLDLLFEVLLPGRRGDVALDLDLERKQRMRITGVPLAQADALLGALSRRLSSARETERGVA